MSVHVIAVANLEGGADKTTSVNLSKRLAATKKKTLLLDMDPQAKASSECGIIVADNTPCMYEVLLQNTPLKQVIQKTDVPFLEVAPSHIRLTNAEVEMHSIISREQLLHRALQQARKTYDYIVINCTPSRSLLMLNALTATNSVLIPEEYKSYAPECLSKLLNSIRLVQKHLNHHLTVEIENC